MSSLLRVVVHNELAQALAQERDILLVDLLSPARQDAAAEAADLFAGTNDRTVRKRCIIRRKDDLPVHLQKAGLFIAVDKIFVDGVEQVAVPTARLARQHQQLTPFADAVDDEDRLILQARVFTAQALCPLARLRAAVEEKEAHLAAVARRQRLGDLQQRHNAGLVGVAVVLLIRAVFRIKERHSQKQQKQRQRHVRNVQRERHRKRDQKAARDQQQRKKRKVVAIDRQL